MKSALDRRFQRCIFAALLLAVGVGHSQQVSRSSADWTKLSPHLSKRVVTTPTTKSTEYRAYDFQGRLELMSLLEARLASKSLSYEERSALVAEARAVQQDSRTLDRAGASLLRIASAECNPTYEALSDEAELLVVCPSNISIEGAVSFNNGRKTVQKSGEAEGRLDIYVENTPLPCTGSCPPAGGFSAAENWTASDGESGYKEIYGGSLF